MATVDLTWTDNSSSETGFPIYRATGSSPSFPGDYTQIATNSADDTTYSDTNAPDGSTVWYAVTAENGNGESSETTDSVTTPHIVAITPASTTANALDPGTTGGSLTATIPVGVSQSTAIDPGVSVGQASTTLAAGAAQTTGLDVSTSVGATGPTWETTGDWDSGQSEIGVHHFQPIGTDWASADNIEKGYLTTDEGGNSLEAYWPLDEDSGSTVNGVTANANDGTNNGATVGSSGILGTTAYTFSAGTSEHIEVPHDASFDFATTDFSIVAWIKVSSHTSTNQAIVSHRQDYAGQGFPGYDLVINPDSAPFLKLVIEDTDSISAPTSDSNVPTGSWVFVGVTCDRSGDATFYQDGSSDGTSDISSQSGDLSNGRALRMGGMEDDQGNIVDNLNGDLDEVRIYSRELGATEISDLYNAAL